MDIIIITAYSKNYVIGKKGRLPWHLRSDLHLFKSFTLGHPIIMGRKTFDSIGKPLPQRKNIVLSRYSSSEYENVSYFDSVEKSLDYCRSQNRKRVFCIGGGEVYKQILTQATHLFISQVDVWIPNGDTYFPKINFTEWRCTQRAHYSQSQQDEYSFTHSQWKRKLRNDLVI